MCVVGLPSLELELLLLLVLLPVLLLKLRYQAEDEQLEDVVRLLIVDAEHSRREAMWLHVLLDGMAAGAP